MDRRHVNQACVRASANAKHAAKAGLGCMLMAPGPSGWVAGATESRLPVGAEQVVGPKVDPRAVVASKEALMAARLQARKPNAMGSSTNTRDYQSTIWIDGLACISGALTWCPHCTARLTRRPQIAERADGVGDEPATGDMPRRHSVGHGHCGGSAPAAHPRRDRPIGARLGPSILSGEAVQEPRGGGRYVFLA